MKRTLCSSLIAGLFAAATHAGALAQQAAPAPAASYAAAPAAAGVSGVDVGAIDTSVRAQDDFFRYSQGKWLKDVAIPADRSSWGAFNVAQDKVEEQIRSIIEQAAADKTAQAGSGTQKMGDYYTSFIDQPARNALGLAPLKADLARIAGLRDKRGIAVLTAQLSRAGVDGPLGMSVHQDERASTQMIVDVSQSGLGLPNRDYYLQDEPRLKDIRAQYQVHIEKMLTLAGHANAAQQAAQIAALETEIARVQWSAVENRDPVKGYNKLSFAQLGALAPGFDWTAWMKGMGVAGKIKTINVSQPSFIAGLDKIIAATPVEVWRAYFEWRLLNAYAPYLSQQFVDESFAFRGAVLSGAKENRSLEKRAIAQVNRDLSEVVGQAYVGQHFPPERKQQVEAMVKNFIIAFREGIEKLDWMTDETKKQAQIKLSKMKAKIGYPDKWRDYSSLTIARNDLIGNVKRVREFGHQFSINKLGKPVDRAAWSMSPQTVNAYYSPSLNEVVFPAARLQYPLYDANAEPAVNYGAVGISIGHEISHAFDDQGSQFDGDGNLRNWWTKQDAEKFAARGKVLVAQYGAYSPLPGYNVNGELTLGENIADNAGAIMASRAYAISLQGKPAPVIDGFSAQQRLFMGLAQARRGKARDAALVSQVKSDPHSPSEFRVNGSMRNHPDFYQVYDVKPGDKMYLAPEQRVIFW